jgi:hypothetical protein
MMTGTTGTTGTGPPAPGATITGSEDGEHERR